MGFSFSQNFGTRQEYEEIDGPGRTRSPHRSKLVIATLSTLLIAFAIVTLATRLVGLPRLVAESQDSLTNLVPLIAPELDYGEESNEERFQRCQGIDWEQACRNLAGGAGARRRRLVVENDHPAAPFVASDLEEAYLLDVDDPSVVYDEHCLRVYRLDLLQNITFPYHANNLLRAGGNQTMTLFIQHGAMRDADKYFCSFRQLMKSQTYRPFDDILIIAPDFNYKQDVGVLPTDAFWNSSKPTGDWRGGAQSDPECCSSDLTLSSYEILDHMLRILTSKKLYPRMDKISYVGHSAGAQMVQRYALTSRLAAKHDAHNDAVALEFVVANPSSYAYLDNRRWNYHCGECQCTRSNCTCSQDCSIPHRLGVPTTKKGTEAQYEQWVCADGSYNSWPYGIDLERKEYLPPYILNADMERAVRLYGQRNVIYMVGQNDTCNDGLPTCDSSCWKRLDFLPGEESCFRNHMDNRCPAMLEGPNRRTRGLQYMDYLREIYGNHTHVLHVIDGVGHNATAMFSSTVGLLELFD
jgi:pimeloyl-ACP methyl ester carboxylesterase